MYITVYYSQYIQLGEIWIHTSVISNIKPTSVGAMGKHKTYADTTYIKGT